MPRRLPGTLLLALLLFGLLLTRPAWAKTDYDGTTDVMVLVSPLTLLMQNQVTVKVGEYTCVFLNGIEPASVCKDVPPGDYEVSATSEGYIVSPRSYNVHIGPGRHNAFYFKLYQNNHQLYMPSVQAEP